MNTKLEIEFSDANDLHNFNRYCEKARQQEGTVGSLWSGLVCSALKRSKVKQSREDELLKACTYALEYAESEPFIELHGTSLSKRLRNVMFP